MIIIDGKIYDGELNTINPERIKYITVLKDASATSLYGARGANGVIVVTTKDGKGIKERRKGFFRRLFTKRHKD